MAPTMTGKPRPPVAFGEYEVGRSKKPINQKPTAAFKDGMKKGMELEPQGDPGAYDPYTNSDLVASASFTHNKTSKPFMATSTRELAMQLYGEDAPGPGAYMAADSAKKQYPAVDPNISVFRSGSLQRPKNDTPVPGSGTYSPNMASVYANQRDSGAQMRSAGGRFREDLSMTEEAIGPGAYDDHLIGSLVVDAQKSLDRASKIRPAFNTTSSQNALPFLPQDTPGPGSYNWDKLKSEGLTELAGSAAFRSGAKKDVDLEPQGDPGAYDPYTNSDLVASASFTHNKTSKPFMATSTRELAMQLYGEDAPGPGAYMAADSAKKQYPAVDPNISVFRSGSLQRPKNDTPVPGSGTYSPNMASVYANQRDSGAQMRSAGGRFREDLSMTEPIVGPGSYEQLDGSLYIDAQKSVSKTSKIRPAFGTTSSQNALPFLPQDTPGPGSYEPLEPRVSKSKTKSPARAKAAAPPKAAPTPAA